MKILKSTLLLLNLLLSISCLAQIEMLAQEEASAQAQINLSTDILKITGEEKQGSNKTISIAQLELVDKDLIIHLAQQPFENGEYLILKLEVKLNGEVLLIEPENLFGDINKQIKITPEAQQHKIIWTNLIEEYIDLTGELSIKFTTEIHGNRNLPYNVDCGIEPTFTTKQKMPFLIAAGLGAGAVLAGQYLENEADKDYETYLSQETFDEAEPFYQDANDKANTGRILTYAGAAVLAVDAVWFFIRQRRFKKQRDVYNEFCNPNKISFQPYIDLPLGNRGLSTNLRMVYTF